MMTDPTLAPSVRFDVIAYTDLSPSEEQWKLLGKGSFGCVWRAEYLGLPVAVKEVLASTEYDVEKYFGRECKILQETRHPNIVQYIGLCLAPLRDDDRSVPGGKPGQRILIVSEYISHGNLRSYIMASEKTHPLPWRLRISFATDVTRALAYLHTRGCLHRDIKGENLLVTEVERLKLADFGFARLAARNDEEIKRLTWCGTEGSMAPEILKGLPFGLESDIFSLGVLFCELASRQLVDSDVFAREMPDYTIDPTEVRDRASAGCPVSFLALILACLSPTPADRPNIRTVLAALRTIEIEVMKRDGSVHIGSIGFASARGRNGATEAGRRMPSFSSQAKRSSASSSLLVSHDGDRPGKDDDSDSDEDEEEALALLDADLASSDSSFGCSALTVDQHSNAVVSRSSAISAASTVRASPRSKNHGSRFAEGSSLPSIPSSWLATVARPTATDAASKHSANVSHGDEGATENDDAPQEFVDAWGPSRFTDTVAASVAAQLSHDSTTDDSKDPGNLHRFSLVKPGWSLKSFNLGIGTSATNLNRSEIRVLKERQAQQAATRPGKAKAAGGLRQGGTGLLGAVFARCDVCERRLGIGKPFLQCDDCPIKCHVSCSADAASDCAGDAILRALAPSEPLVRPLAFVPVSL